MSTGTLTLVSDDPLRLRLLIDEDLSPRVSQRLREEAGIDAVAVRDRGKLGACDRTILDLAFAEDRILITANAADFRRLAEEYDLHSGVVLLLDGELSRTEQWAVITAVVQGICAEWKAGRDMVNRVLWVERDGTLIFETIFKR